MDRANVFTIILPIYDKNSLSKSLESYKAKIDSKISRSYIKNVLQMFEK